MAEFSVPEIMYATYSYLYFLFPLIFYLWL